MTAHPEDVVTLLITNPESLSPATFAADFASAGLDALAYVPPQSTTARDEWPTLGELVDSGKRLVVFMDYGADFSAAPYIIDGGSSCWRFLLSWSLTLRRILQRVRGRIRYHLARLFLRRQPYIR